MDVQLGQSGKYGVKPNFTGAQPSQSAAIIDGGHISQSKKCLGPDNFSQFRNPLFPLRVLATLSLVFLSACSPSANETRDKAVELKGYRNAAEQGDASAQFQLGAEYADGGVLPQDDVESVRWYRKAAEQGDASAQNNLGMDYANGVGVEQDYAEAAKWIRKAAEQGLAAAQNNLGTAYAKGKGVKQDAHEAVKWYLMAVNQGDASAQNNLGIAYLKGIGVPQDIVAAYKWVSLAADQGLSQAQQNKETIELEMTAEQLIQGLRVTQK